MTVEYPWYGQTNPNDNTAASGLLGATGLSSDAAEQLANDAASGRYGSANGGSYSSSEEPMIRRRTTRTPRVPHGANAEGATKGRAGDSYTAAVPLSEYDGEFFQRWQDPNFIRWFASRAIAAGMNKATDNTGDFFETWQKLGRDVANIPGWQGTPEQFLEWKASGRLVDDSDLMDSVKAGDVMIDPKTGKATTSKRGKDGNPLAGDPLGMPGMSGSLDGLSPIQSFPTDGNDDPLLSSEYTWQGSPDDSNAGVGASVQGDLEGMRYVPPITSQTNVNTVTMSREAAYAAADQIAQALLGRMASNKEMAIARKAMNRVLAKNPTKTTTTRDATDPDNVHVSTHTSEGASPSDAADFYRMQVQRSSEGMAFNAGKMIEQAMRMMG